MAQVQSQYKLSTGSDRCRSPSDDGYYHLHFPTPFTMHPSTSLTKFAVQTSLTVLICGPFYLPYTKSKELRQARAATGGNGCQQDI
ncbi:hypothetical protein BDV30DRAFT_207689 [Aspergillus minisclerotigenes]|uniref:Uncharacterized protein n=1 Tax=Aspergillus minisclerotigenes TaxID=656917 RepID=A0A5N6JC42_9EURO|nr:hypothetical protein BDV30DRAFT_207689 [Aspergillus minisclerotigenes]